MSTKKIAILILLSLNIFIFSACQPAYSYTPNYSTLSFCPNSPTHWHCSYEDGSYYYYDYSDRNIYQIGQEADTSLYDYPYVNQMVVVNGNIYLRESLSSIYSINVLTKEEQKSQNTDYQDFLIDKKNEVIFAFDRDNGLDMLSVVDITTTPIDVLSLLSFSEKETGEYIIVSDDVYDYAIWNGAYYKGDIIKGIRNKATGEIVFREVESMDKDSLLHMTSDEMVFINRSYGFYDALMKYSKDKGLEEFFTLPDGYYFYPNNVINENDKLIALVQKNNPISVIGNYNMARKYHEADALISVDIESGDCEYLYETVGNDDRIVGYFNDYAYLFKKGRKPNIFSAKSLDAIYRVDLSSDEEKLIHEFEKENTNYTFELCGEKIFVWGDIGGFIGAYDLAD